MNTGTGATSALMRTSASGLPEYQQLPEQCCSAAFIHRSGIGLPHVLGNELGGGYEFMAADGPVPQGIFGLELDPMAEDQSSHGRVGWFPSSNAALTVLAARAVEC